MSTLEELGKAKNFFMISLGDKSSLYMKLMKKWFKMEISKMEFDVEVHKFLSPEQMRMHNRLMGKLFTICSDLQLGPLSPSVHKSTNGTSSKRKRQHSASFQVAAILEYICDKKFHRSRKEKKPTEPVKYFLNEKGILDEAMLFGRFIHAAWENDLDGAYRDCAKLLAIAVQDFLKNVVTAIFSERCGYKVKGKSFIYEMGLPIPNPWLRSATKWNEPEICTSLVAAKRKSNLIGPDLAVGSDQESEAPTREQVEQNILHWTSKVNTFSDRSYRRKPVSIPEVMNALRVNRSVILSESIYFACMERLIAAHTHPGHDE